MCVLAGCHAVAWQPGPSSTWRDEHCYRGALATVAARDEAAASDAYCSVEGLLTAMREAGMPDPGPVLVLARSIEDPLLLDEPMPTVRQLLQWHQAAIGGPVDEGQSQPRTETPELLETAARLVAAAIPLDASELALPADWRAGIDWAVVLPTTACAEAAAGRMLDIGLEQQDMSFGKRLLLAPMLPFVRRAARAEVRREVCKRVLEAAVAAARRRGEVSDAAVQQVRQALDLDDA